MKYAFIIDTNSLDTMADISKILQMHNVEHQVVVEPPFMNIDRDINDYLDNDKEVALELEEIRERLYPDMDFETFKEKTRTFITDSMQIKAQEFPSIQDIDDMLDYMTDEDLLD